MYFKLAALKTDKLNNLICSTHRKFFDARKSMKLLILIEYLIRKLFDYF